LDRSFVAQTIAFRRLRRFRTGRVENGLERLSRGLRLSPYFHEVSRAVGPGGQATKSDGLLSRLNRLSRPLQVIALKLSSTLLVKDLAADQRRLKTNVFICVDLHSSAASHILAFSAAC
jgi:hypothetical protein